MSGDHMRISLLEESGQNHTAEVTLDPSSNLTETTFTTGNVNSLLISSLLLLRPRCSFLQDSEGKSNNYLNESR